MQPYQLARRTALRELSRGLILPLAWSRRGCASSDLLQDLLGKRPDTAVCGGDGNRVFRDPAQHCDPTGRRVDCHTGSHAQNPAALPTPLWYMRGNDRFHLQVRSPLNSCQRSSTA